MKIFRNWRLGENMLYTLVWVAIFLIPFMNAQLMSETVVDFNKVIISWGKIAPYFLIFIVNTTILAPQLLLRNRYWLYSILLLAMLFAIFGTIEIGDFQYWQENAVLRDKASFTDLEWYWNVLLGVFMAGANSMIKLYYRTLETERRMTILEKQNIETEMQYLKYQINPHFLMNTLNNIHAMIDFDAELAKQCVMELSRLLRHVLYDSSGSTTSLDKEVDFIHNYIELMRVRYIDDVEIKLNTPNINTCRKVVIPPLLLIVLVENAFKHGISYDKPSYIDINIAVDTDTLTCVVSNSRHTSQDTEHSGIGLNNITKRLDLLFGSSYTLTTDSSSLDQYIVELVIPINKQL
ncbi:MAG: histidine kinase [Alistipes sp.]|nr:histidine kinase [Alistipes sp.]